MRLRLTLLACLACLPAAAAVPDHFFADDALTLAVQVNVAEYPTKYLEFWIGDGNGEWRKNNLEKYVLYFDHGWFSEWQSLYRPRRLWMMFLGPDTVVLYEPDVVWWSDPLHRVVPPQ